MSITLLPNGRLRVQVYDPVTGKNVSAAKVLGLPREKSTFEDTRKGRREAFACREAAREKLHRHVQKRTTLAEFAERWTTDPIFQRQKESTNIHNRERIKRFVERYGHLPIADIGDGEVGAWTDGGKNRSTVPVLKAMFNDAASADGGRLVAINPFVGVRIIKRTRGEEDPPTEEQVWAMIHAARKLTSPGFAAWLQVACFTGMRPGELDALRWDAIDFEHDRILVNEQFNAKTKTTTLPKNGKKRKAPLTGPAREALLALPRESSFCFLSIRGSHFTPSARAYHWKAVKAAAGWDKSLYLATRHHAGWYMRNVLRLDAEDTAKALGHTDGGMLVRSTYGHLEEDGALDRVVAAYAQRGNVRPLRAVV